MKYSVKATSCLLISVGLAGMAKAATDCNLVTEISPTECQSLLDLYYNTQGANWLNNTGWNQTNTPCSWFGITCNGRYIQKIDVHQNNLTGTLPNLNLAKMQVLWLFSNQLTGNIPSFNNLPNLQNLRLDSNQLSGSIPNFTGFNLNSLQYLKLNNNCGLMAYDAAQEVVLNQKDSSWQTKNPRCKTADTNSAMLPGIDLVKANPNNYGLFTQTQIDQAKQSGIQFCQDNPASCGLFSQTQVEVAKQAGIEQGKNDPTCQNISNAIHATYHPSDGELHIPLLDVISIFGVTPTYDIYLIQRLDSFTFDLDLNRITLVN